MPVGSHRFWLPRRGNNPDEYEDALALDDVSGRYALADGSTEGCFTGLWARLLVADFVARGECDGGRWPSSLPAVQELWDADVRARKLDWDTDYWVERGAFAAFLGLVLTDSPRPPAGEALARGYPGGKAAYRWQAMAVGDTCLFHTRANVLLRAFPLDCSEAFGNRPQLIGSRMPVDEVYKRQRLWNDGCGQPGDRLWAMTDALAKCCLKEHEAGSDPWHELESVLGNSPSARGAGKRVLGDEGAPFTPWIESLRDSGRLQNDDVTLLAIYL